jgi:hypothetical protein
VPEPNPNPPQPPANPPPPVSPPPASDPPIPPPGDVATMEALRREAAEARSQIRQLESQLAVSADAGKSELERALARADRAEKKAAAHELSAVRQAVAAAKSVPVELLVGDDKTVIEAQADKLAAWGKGLVDAAVADAGKRRSGVLDVGRGTPISDKADMNDYIRQGFRR